MAVTSPYQCAGLSDPGKKRSNNEDRFHVDPDRGIFFVIDGVGGQNAGEKAADTAHDLLRLRLERQVGDVEDRIREAITVANNEIYNLSQSNPDWRGMACVLTVAVVQDGEVTIGQVGDSRLYLIEPGQIRKLTHDHSPVGEREDRGELDETTAMRHPRRNEVYRDVGSEEHAPDDPDFIEITTSPFPIGSTLLLCSDGLSDLVSSQQMLAAVESNLNNPEAAARILIQAANEAGGKDNITVVLVSDPHQSRTKVFPNASARTFSAGESNVEKSTVPGKLVFLLLGMVLTLAAALALKPHWRETQNGTIFGFGTVREPQTWRVSSEINPTIATARPGDTVLVPAGVYHEQLRLKEGVRVVAESPRESILSASGVAVTAEDLRSGRLEGFRIVPSEQGPLQVGLRLTNSAIDVVDNEITGTTQAAIETTGLCGGTLRANHIYLNPGSGVVLNDSGTVRLVHNVVTGNGKAGIELHSGANPILMGNTLSRNGEDLVVPQQFNRELALRQNFIAASEPLKPKPKPRKSAK